MTPLADSSAESDFTQQPTTSERHIQVINRTIVPCAKDLVIASRPEAEVEALMQEFAAYRVGNEFVDLRMADGSFINGHRLRDPAANSRYFRP